MSTTLSKHYADGRRVEIPTHFDSWMMGDRFGLVVKVTRTHLHVKLDRSGRVLRIDRETFEDFGRVVES